MKSLPTLIKLAQRNIDAIAVLIAKAQMRVDELNTQKATLQARVEVEQYGMDGAEIAMSAFMPAFMERVKIQTEQFNDQIAEAERDVERIREQLNLAYREKSKLENLQTQYQIRARAEENRLEQVMLDEAAILRR